MCVCCMVCVCCMLCVVCVARCVVCVMCGVCDVCVCCMVCAACYVWCVVCVCWWGGVAHSQAHTRAEFHLESLGHKEGHGAGGRSRVRKTWSLGRGHQQGCDPSDGHTTQAPRETGPEKLPDWTCHPDTPPASPKLPLGVPLGVEVSCRAEPPCSPLPVGRSPSPPRLCPHPAPQHRCPQRQDHPPAALDSHLCLELWAPTSWHQRFSAVIPGLIQFSSKSFL